MDAASNFAFGIVANCLSNFEALKNMEPLSVLGLFKTGLDFVSSLRHQPQPVDYTRTFNYWQQQQEVKSFNELRASYEQELKDYLIEYEADVQQHFNDLAVGEKKELLANLSHYMSDVTEFFDSERREIDRNRFLSSGVIGIIIAVILLMVIAR